MNVYSPREDTYLIKRYLEEKDLQDKKALDMGTGSGILAVEMAENGAETTAADINPEALESAAEKAEKAGIELKLIQSDLFEEIDERFDLIVFNPPYLPGDEMEGSEKWRGGEKGVETTQRFIEKYSEHLKDGGEALFVVSSRSDTHQMIERFEVVNTENLWFEKLYLLRGK